MNFTYTLRTKDGQIVATMNKQCFKTVLMGVSGHIRPTIKGTTAVLEIDSDGELDIKHGGLFESPFNLSIRLHKGMFLAVE